MPGIQIHTNHMDKRTTPTWQNYCAPPKSQNHTHTQSKQKIDKKHWQNLTLDGHQAINTRHNNLQHPQSTTSKPITPQSQHYETPTTPNSEHNNNNKTNQKQKLNHTEPVATNKL